MLKKILLTGVLGSTLCANVLAANTLITMTTNKGPIEIELYNDKAPISAKNFEEYVKSDFYKDTIFHRVIPGFMIQGGGFDDQMKEKQTRAPIKNESYNNLSNTRGTLAMARTNDPNSASSQFFINLVDNTYLDKNARNDGYAVFGRVVKGMDVVDEIAKTPTRNYAMHQDVPAQSIKIEKVEIKQ